MNRKNEFEAMMEELDQPVPGLETTLDRAYRKRKKRTATMTVRSLGGLAACFAAFVLLVNYWTNSIRSVPKGSKMNFLKPVTAADPSTVIMSSLTNFRRLKTPLSSVPEL